ncbi:hypothetical protein [Halobaculum rubrum]|uniref:hypothetical protein n=1 Tax=Halobaculum rubrum TaxID=2872158 RepID=UPI001CED32F3|nr:hypothetical protein [Halobaculum rubrum]
MRPKIPDTLAQRIEEVYRHGNHESGAELVRHAARKRVNELEAEYHAQEKEVRDVFDYEIRRSMGGGVQIRLTPRTNSPVRFKYFSKGDPPHTTILDTGTSYIGEDTLKSALQMEGVKNVNILTEGTIRVDVSEENQVPLSGDEDTFVDRIYDAMGDLIQERNRRVVEGEESKDEAYKRAIRDYWKYSHQL